MKARSLARQDEGVAFSKLLEKYVRFPSIDAFAEMSQDQFEFLIESIRYEIEKKRKQQEAKNEQDTMEEEVHSALKRLDALEGKTNIG